MKKLGKPCTENEFWGLNQASKESRLIVQVIYCDDQRKSEMFHVRGLAMVTRRACEGGLNLTIEAFVPDPDPCCPDCSGLGRRFCDSCEGTGRKR
jgi:hypothetical protein